MGRHGCGRVGAAAQLSLLSPAGQRASAGQSAAKLTRCGSFCLRRAGGQHTQRRSQDGSSDVADSDRMVGVLDSGPGSNRSRDAVG